MASTRSLLFFASPAPCVRVAKRNDVHCSSCFKRKTSFTAPAQIRINRTYSHLTSPILRRRVTLCHSLSLTAPTAETVPKGVGGNVGELLGTVRHLSGELFSRPYRLPAIAWTCAVLAFALASTMYSVGLSVILRLFWNALSAKDPARFAKLMKLYCVAVVIGPIVISSFDWFKARLALLWREALTNKLLRNYLAAGSQPYYKITNVTVGDMSIDNADQRLSDDIRGFTERAVRFLCVFGVSVFDLAIFSVVLYKIYPPLFTLVIAYCVVGSIAISLFGRKLIGLNIVQLSREADYRFSLLRIRDNAESIAFYSGESSEREEALRRFRAICRNAVNLFGMNRNISFLANSHKYWVQVIPSFVIVPVYFSGNIALGAVSQTLFAFNHVLSSMGVVVSEFSALSEFGAGIRRIERLSEAIDAAQSPQSDGTLGIQTTFSPPEAPAKIVISGLSIQTPPPAFRPLVQNLNLTVEAGHHLVINGSSGIGKTSLLRAVAGLWTSGVGNVQRPNAAQMLFIPQKPFLTLGSLRENVTYGLELSRAEKLTDEDIEFALLRVNLPDVVRRMGGLNASGEDIGRRLSLGEQQRLAFARLICAQPKLAVLDESTSALDEENERLIYNLVCDLGVTCIIVTNRASIFRERAAVLSLLPEGRWEFTAAKESPTSVAGMAS